jgi:Fe-S cluster biogenesis protein NfuA
VIAMTDDQDFQRRIARVEALTRSLEGISDPALRASVKELTQSVMDLHGTAIQRMLEVVHASGPQGAAIVDSLGKDPLIGSLLILYGLHPLDMQSRVSQAIERLQPTFRKHRVDVELMDVEEGVVRLRITASPSAAARALKSSIEEQIYATAPDVTRIEGLNALGASDFVEIESLAAAGKGRD